MLVSSGVYILQSTENTVVLQILFPSRREFLMSSAMNCISSLVCKHSCAKRFYSSWKLRTRLPCLTDHAKSKWVQESTWVVTKDSHHCCSLYFSISSLEQLPETALWVLPCCIFSSLQSWAKHCSSLGGQRTPFSNPCKSTQVHKSFLHSEVPQNLTEQDTWTDFEQWEAYTLLV